MANYKEIYERELQEKRNRHKLPEYKSEYLKYRIKCTDVIRHSQAVYIGVMIRIIAILAILYGFLLGMKDMNPFYRWFYF